MLLPLKHRSALAKFCCGVAPIRLETGRYERLAVNNRICPLCNTEVENEIHVLLNCPQYNDIRQTLFDKAKDINNGFPMLSDVNKLNVLLSNCDIVREVAKSCHLILEQRVKSLYYN